MPYCAGIQYGQPGCCLPCMVHGGMPPYHSVTLSLALALALTRESGASPPLPPLLTPWDTQRLQQDSLWRSLGSLLQRLDDPRAGDASHWEGLGRRVIMPETRPNKTKQNKKSKELF